MSGVLTAMVGINASRAIVTYQASSLAQDNTNQITYTFTGRPFGPAAADRVIIAVLSWEQNSSARDFVSATIGGVAATLHVERTRVQAGSAIISALVPAGTSGTISFTLSATANSGGVAGVYAVTGLVNAAPHHTASMGGTGTGPASVTLNLPTGGFAIAGGMTYNSDGGPHGWTFATKNQEGTVARQVNSSAHAEDTSLTTGQSIEASWAANRPYSFCALSWA
ncbi:MAG: hypothetical protein Q7V31_12035 [Parvibaculum sp.]|uniref:hypothetical protein n=1 Tax=Parvibaculum sp. TaxID=2024848 RepID=UPI00271A20A4|nr:hypothetical protein [Parvibaculum sp.]MDO8839646.1 hypothetical protein [Parvibaculum sp.]